MGAAPARAQLRYCERRSETCWACADVEAGFAIPCAGTPCPDGQLCVTREGSPECHASTLLCCETAECAFPPGCEGAARACGTPAEPTEPETCTFLSPCPEPLPMLDAGVTLDAGTSRQDANASDLDAAIAEDASTPPDAGMPPPRDAGSARMDASRETLTVSFAGGGGCRCGASGGSRPSASWLLCALVVGAIVVRRRARHRGAR